MTSSGIVADIKSKLSVVDIVGETVALKRAGTAYKGLCPFHAEKTPSFVVNPDRESWHCFGCGEGGDIFSFVMRRDGLEFREALERLAERAGVELSERSAREDRHRKRLRDALEAAIAWYREVLLRTPQAELARAYLAERALSDETLERFGIGFAPATWDALTKRLRARGFSDEELLGAGLASPSNRGGVIDKFRGRIIIPIRDQSGRAVGLGGRIMPGAEGPKYLNSPATALFDKSRTLFAIDLAKAAIRREKLAVIVEGYTDVMAAHQAGFTNVVASLGTALTRGQIELALRYGDAIAIAFDIDSAGQAAKDRSLLADLTLDEVRKVRVIEVPDGKDPDELIRSAPEEWGRVVDRVKAKNYNLMEYLIDDETKDAIDAPAAERLDAAERVLAHLARFNDPLWQATYTTELARRLKLDERALQARLAQRLKPPAVEKMDFQKRREETAEPMLSPLEAEAIQLLLLNPDAADQLDDAEILDGEGRLPFRDAVALSLIDAWRRRAAEAGVTGAELEAFVGGLDPATAALARGVLADIARADAGPRLSADQARDALRTCLLRLRTSRIDEAMRDGRLLVEEAQREGDRARLELIEQQIMRLGREKAEVTRAMREPARAGARRS